MYELKNISIDNSINNPIWCFGVRLDPGGYKLVLWFFKNGVLIELSIKLYLGVFLASCIANILKDTHHCCCWLPASYFSTQKALRLSFVKNF